MGLTGLDPNSPIPGDFRELILGAGTGEGAIGSRPVILVGNKTSAGSETVDVLDAKNPVADDADAQARCGKRSELYWMYKKYVEVDPDAEIYLLAVTEAGTASTVELTVSGASDAVTDHEIHIHGEYVSYTTASGDSQTTTASGIANAINDAASGSLQVTAVAAIDGAGPDYKVTITTANTGVRFSHIIGSTATLGVRVRALQSGNAQTVVKNTGSYVAGGTEDDGTTAFASAVNYEAFYWALPWTETGAFTATDNQVGECVTNLITQALPINGKEQIAVAGVVRTNAQAVTAATGAGGNSVHLHVVWQENSDWTPAMLAAHHTAVKRSQEIAHPCENLAGYTRTDNTVYNVPAPYSVADRPTRTEIRNALNNGVTPIGCDANGRTYIVRDITSKCQDSSGNADYKAREGHIYSGTSFVWQLFKARYASQKQPFVDDDPAEGQMPTARTTTPGLVKAIFQDVIDDMVSSKPLGRYDGPILAPSLAQWMKDHVAVSKVTAGINVGAQIVMVEHNLKSETKIREVGDAY